MQKLLLLLLLISVWIPGKLFAQGSISGTVTDAESKQPLPSANIVVTGTKLGTVTAYSGKFVVGPVPAGRYTVTASFLGYASASKNVAVGRDDVTVDFSLAPGAVEIGEIVVEVNRARDRQTPAAFSTADGRKLSQNLHSQDAPLLMKTLPGIFSFSTDGVGNGESKMYVRGFDQNHVQVLINGIPINDPESNAVYWSNWGAVSTSAASIQVQRGAGSSLYGAGSFGGSFNVITQEMAPKFAAEVHASTGDPALGVYGLSLQSGLMSDNLLAGSLLYEWKTGRGSREGAYYQGANYYFGVAAYPNSSSSMKFVLHGGPQEHGYSYNAPVAYFRKYGYGANPAYFLPVGVLTQMIGTKTVEDSLRLGGGSRLLRDSKYIALSHNFYHKPQFEIHCNSDINESNNVRGTFFYSVGRGGGSSVNSTGNLSSPLFGADTLGRGLGTSAYDILDPGTGAIMETPAAAQFVAKTFLANAFQRISYSLHRQWGFIGSWESKPADNLTLTVGGEYRDWLADHPGHFTNLYGKTAVNTQRYAFRKINGAVSSSQFTRRTYQGDMTDFGGADKVDVNYLNPFMGCTLNDDNGTYNTQYRNYEGNTKQGTLFLQANYKMDKLFMSEDELLFLGSVQYVSYNYRLKENMPSESAIADTVAGWNLPGAVMREGLNGDGYFYMSGYKNAAAAAPDSWYKFKLVNETRSRGFFQPKFGINYNMTKEINVFASYAHVERLVDLGVWYNAGNVNKDASDEKSDQWELGAGFKNEDLSAKVNLYAMSWDNKTASIQDISKAGLAGYDRNGFRYELVGSSKNRGIEVEANYQLGNMIALMTGMQGFNGLSISLAFTAMDNKWTKVLDEVKTDPITGKRRAFDAGALNSAGAVDTLFFDELEGTVNASTPFMTTTVSAGYSADEWFATLTVMNTASHYALDGGTYVGVDGTWDAGAPVPKFVTKYQKKLPAATLFDFAAGMNLKFNMIRFRLSAQVINLLDTEFLVNANRSGVLPGISRTFRLNMAAGI